MKRAPLWLEGSLKNVPLCEPAKFPGRRISERPIHAERDRGPMEDRELHPVGSSPVVAQRLVEEIFDFAVEAQPGTKLVRRADVHERVLVLVLQTSRRSRRRVQK